MASNVRGVLAVNWVREVVLRNWDGLGPVPLWVVRVPWMLGPPVPMPRSLLVWTMLLHLGSGRNLFSIDKVLRTSFSGAARGSVDDLTVAELMNEVDLQHLSSPYR